MPYNLAQMVLFVGLWLLCPPQFYALPHIGSVLPAVGYHPSQLEALGATINAADVDVVVSATPCNLNALIDINKPIVRARYEFAEVGEPGLGSLVETFLVERGLWKQ